MMMGFVAAAIAMLIAIVPAGIVLCRGELAESVVAFEFISAVMVMVLALLAQAFRRSGEFELAVLLAVLMYASGLVYVRAMERWL
jgi:multisubunit Na+/H+ antiporter MnhF subunit